MSIDNHSIISVHTISVCYFVFTQQIGFGSTGLYDGDIYDGPSNKSV